MEEMALQGISPVFIGWHDCGQVLHTHRSQSYGRRVVRHYEIEYIVFSHSGYILTDGLPLQTIPHTVFVRRPGMEAEGGGVQQRVFLQAVQKGHRAEPAAVCGALPAGTGQKADDDHPGPAGNHHAGGGVPQLRVLLADVQGGVRPFAPGVPAAGAKRFAPRAGKRPPPPLTAAPNCDSMADAKAIFFLVGEINKGKYSFFFLPPKHAGKEESRCSSLL